MGFHSVVRQTRGASSVPCSPLYKRPRPVESPGLPGSAASDVGAQPDRASRLGHSIDRLRLGAGRRAGRSLSQALRRKMEASFAADFSGVRIHEGREAPSLDAVAFTRGADIHFAPGKYQPHSLRGQALIGHELAHVVQQRAGRVSAPQGRGLPINSDPALEAEADALGEKAARGARAPIRPERPASPPASAAGEPVQCNGKDDKIDKKKLIGSGLAFGGLAAKGMFTRHMIHKFGGSQAKGFETGGLGLLRHLSAVRAAPLPIKLATGAAVASGMAASSATGFTRNLFSTFKNFKLQRPPDHGGEYDMPIDPSTGTRLRHPSMYQFSSNVSPSAFRDEDK